MIFFFVLFLEFEGMVLLHFIEEYALHNDYHLLVETYLPQYAGSPEVIVQFPKGAQ